VQRARTISSMALARTFTWNIRKLLRRDSDVRPWR
jgi:hypothetical protein